MAYLRVYFCQLFTAPVFHSTTGVLLSKPLFMVVCYNGNDDAAAAAAWNKMYVVLLRIYILNDLENDSSLSFEAHGKLD